MWTVQKQNNLYKNCFISSVPNPSTVFHDNFKLSQLNIGNEHYSIDFEKYIDNSLAIYIIAHSEKMNLHLGNVLINHNFPSFVSMGPFSPAIIRLPINQINEVQNILLSLIRIFNNLNEGIPASIRATLFDTFGLDNLNLLLSHGIHSLNIVNVVWGEEYTRLFLEISLASQLTPKNIPTMKSLKKYFIYTNENSKEIIYKHPNYNKLTKLVEVVFINIDKDLNLQIELMHPYHTIYYSHKNSFERCFHEQAAMITVAPDIVYK